MRIRLVCLLLAALALPATGAQAQAGRSLPAFGSERELSDYLEQLAREAERRRAARTEASCGAPPAITVVPAGPGDSAASRPAVVRGRVTNAAGNPENAVLVRIAGLDQGATTSADGRYRLSVLPERLRANRRVRLTASRVGLASQQRQVTLSPGDSAVVDFRLCAAVLQLEGVVATGQGAARAAESVTNVQHEGVDEGGIVKVHGDHLVMLRRGRLFTVAVDHGRLTPVSAVDAFGPDVDPRGTWYDELLVSGDLVVVIGYSYARGGTEVGVFRIDYGGRLRHRSTYHLRSNDYYSSRNYASRLVGTRLVLYTPLWMRLRDGDLAGSLPAMRRWHRGATADEFRPIVSATRVYRPGRELDAAGRVVLHTVMACDLARAEMQCEGTALLGPPGRVFYVSPTAVYVWVSEWARDRGPVRAPAMVYRIPLDGSGPRALGVAGSPVDQFSFLESGDGHLNVLVRSDASGEWMWSAEQARGSVALLRVPLRRFSDGRRAAPPSSYQPLPTPEGGGYAFHNRFVGDHLLYGNGSGWWGTDRVAGSVLYAVRWAGGAVTQLHLPHGVDRIEAMGSDAVVVGTGGRDLHFTGIELDGRPRAAQRYVSRGASQGELRSHGFFYRPDGPDSGLLGLPIRGPGRPGYRHLFDESASVLFLRNEDAAFRELGELAARPETSDNDGCVASCVDWYGNSRPLFLRGRIFALLGYEIVEGALRGGRIRELRRVRFLPRDMEVARR